MDKEKSGFDHRDFFCQFGEKCRCLQSLFDSIYVVISPDLQTIWVPRNVISKSSEVKNEGDIGKLIVEQQWANQYGYAVDEP